jgi:tetratricopeptide (TPR) repeat protein
MTRATGRWYAACQKAAGFFLGILLIAGGMAHGQSASAPTKDAELFLQEASRRIAGNDLPGALAVAQLALQESPDYFKIWLVLSEIHEKMGNFQQAATCLKTAQSYNPKLGEFKESLEYLERMAKEHLLSSDNANVGESSNNQGSADAAAGERRDTLNQVKQLQRSGKFHESFTLLGEACEKDSALLAEDIEDTLNLAVDFYTQRLQQRDRTAPYYRGWFLGLQGKYDGAIHDLEVAGKSGPGDLPEKARRLLTRFTERKKQQDAAIQLAAKPINPRPPSLTSTSTGTTLVPAPIRAVGTESPPVLTSPQVTGTTPAEMGERLAPPPPDAEKIRLLELLQSAEVEELPKILGEIYTLSPVEMPYIAQVLKSEDDDRIFPVLEKLSSLGKQSAGAIPDIMELVENSQNTTRYAAIRALGEIKSAPETVIPFLIRQIDLGKGMGDPSCQALTQFGESALPYLREAINNSQGEMKNLLSMILLETD